MSKRYQNPDVYERLAAGYVLGTLQGAARRRFERLMNDHPYIEEAVNQWQNHLQPLNESIPERKPSNQVWQQIEAITQSSSNDVSKQVSPLKKWLSEVWFWRGLATAMSVLLFVSWIGPLTLSSGGVAPVAKVQEQPAFVAVLEDETQEPVMVATGLKDKRELSVMTTQMPELAASKQWLLWSIPKHGAKPVAVGFLSNENAETKIKFSQKAWLNKVDGVSGFAVSIENKDDMVDQPSGPLMYKGRCLEFT